MMSQANQVPLSPLSVLARARRAFAAKVALNSRLAAAEYRARARDRATRPA